MANLIPSSSRRGSVLLQATFVIGLLMGVTALAVDFGRLTLVQSELQSVADAAARYGVTGLNDNTATSKAIDVAAQNAADGRAVTLAAADVVKGRWNSATAQFTASATPANAVKVTARQSVHMTFASLIGFSDTALSASSVSMRDQPRALLVVGNAASPVAQDSMTRSYLQYAGYTVTLLDDDQSSNANLAGINVIVISDSIESGKVGTKFRDVPIGVVNCEENLFDDFKMCGTTSNTHYGKASPSVNVYLSVRIGNVGPTTLQVYSTASDQGWAKPSSSAYIFAQIDADRTKAAGWYYLPGATMVGMTAPAVRVGLFARNTDRLNSTGWQVLLTCVNIAAGQVNESILTVQ